MTFIKTTLHFIKLIIVYIITARLKFKNGLDFNIVDKATKLHRFIYLKVDVSIIKAMQQNSKTKRKKLLEISLRNSKKTVRK